MEREAMKKRTKAKIELIVSFINLILIIFLIFLRNGDIKVQRVWGVSLGEPYCNPCFIINTNIGEPKSGDLIIYKDGEKDYYKQHILIDRYNGGYLVGAYPYKNHYLQKEYVPKEDYIARTLFTCPMTMTTA